MLKKLSAGNDLATTSGRPLRIIINGAHAKSGGGVTYLRRLLPVLAQQPDLSCTFSFKRTNSNFFYPICDNVHVTLFDHKPTFWKTLWWEQVSLPLIAWGMGAEAVFSPANYGPLLLRNHVILLRNATSVIRLTTRVRPMIYWGLLSVATFVSLLLAKRAIAVSNYAARILTFGLRGVFHRKLDVIYHGTSMPPCTRRNNTSDRKTILAVSDIYIQKNYHTLIQAFGLVHKENPELKLVIVGREIDEFY